MSDKSIPVDTGHIDGGNEYCGALSVKGIAMPRDGEKKSIEFQRE